MKAQFFFPDEFFNDHILSDSLEILQLIESIKEKVHNTLIELLCVPTKEMAIDISSFAEAYKFTKAELYWITDDNQIMTISDMIIKCDRLEIWLEPSVYD